MRSRGMTAVAAVAVASLSLVAGCGQSYGKPEPYDTLAQVPEKLALPENTVANQVAAQGAIVPIAGPLFNQYLLAFEVTSVLLLAAVVGAVVLGKRRESAHAR